MNFSCKASCHIQIQYDCSYHTCDRFCQTLGIRTYLGDSPDHTQSTGSYSTMQFSADSDSVPVLNVTESILSDLGCFDQHYFVFLALSFYQNDVILSSRCFLSGLICCICSFNDSLCLTTERHCCKDNVFRVCSSLSWAFTQLVPYIMASMI